MGNLLQEWDLKINSSLQEIIDNEPLIGADLKDLFHTFKIHKSTFPFGSLCILHYEEYVNIDLLDTDIYLVAAAIELIILAFDIVDDIQDQDTDHVWMNNQALSLNVVLIMLTLAMKVLRKSKFEHRELAMMKVEEYVLKSISGQHLDLLNQCSEEKAYLKMIEQKSGALTALSSMVGTILATGNESLEVENYSVAIGLIQQIKNDIQGLKEWHNKNDLLNKKFSLPIIYLLATDQNDSLKLRGYFEGSINEIDVCTVKNALLNSGAIQYALSIKNIFKNRGINSLQNVSMKEETRNYILNLMK